MAEPIAFATIAAASLASLSLAAAAGLRGWRGWLEVRRLQIACSADRDWAPTPAARIELADLKERVGKLEAIASGSD